MSSPATPGSHGSAPAPNPVLSAYETFVRDTPLVTRYTITALFTSWFLSFFVDPSLALSNVPLFTIFRLELYRILLSPIVCSSLLSLVFAYLGFTNNGKVLEFSMGSTAFAYLLFTLGWVTNIAFLLVCTSFYLLTRNQTWLITSSKGIWTILLGIISIECCKAPSGSKRRLFVFDVPTVYYPLALLALFSLFMGPQLEYMLSVAVGYAYGYGYLDKLKVSNARCSRWEEGILRNFTERQGWVVGSAASGSAAWLPSNNAEAEGGGWRPTSFFQGSRTSTESSGGSSGAGGTVANPPAGGWGGSGPGQVKEPSSPAKPAFPKSGGRALGGARTRPSAEARAAMLEAAAQRSANAQPDEQA